MLVNRSGILAFTLITALVVTPDLQAGFYGSAYVPTGDPVYEFLDLAAARGLIPLIELSARPVTRRDVGQMLTEIAAAYPGLDDRVMRADLDYYIREFAWDMFPGNVDKEDRVRTLRSTAYDITAPLSKPHWHLSAFKDEDFTFLFDPVAWVQMDRVEFETTNADSSATISQRKTIVRRGTGIQFRGTFNRGIGYYFRFVDHTERGNGPYLSRGDLLEDRYGYVGPLIGGDQTYYDLTEAYLATRWKSVDFVFGKDRIAWGPGKESGLLLSGVAPSFDQLRVSARLTKRARFTMVAGRLSPWNAPGDTLYKTDQGWTRIEPPDKWLAAHRLEFAPTDNLLLGVAEAVIWGERGFDLGYFNPLNFFYSAEHNGQDRDNVLMSGDLTWRMMNRALLFGELLLDDLNISELGNGFVGNKIGVNLGVRVLRLPVDGLTTGLTYTRLQPYVYSHFYPVNRYSTWTSGLGTDLKPNSDRLAWDVSYRPLRRITINGGFALHRHGDLGGEIENTPDRRNPRKVKFLDDVEARWTAYIASVGWEPLPGAVVSLGWELNRATREDLPSNQPGEIIYLGVAYRY